MSISKVATNQPFKVQGFKVWGIKLPFTCKTLRTDTVIRLAGIGERIQEREDGGFSIKDTLPLIIEYVAVGLNNNRCFGLLERLYKRELNKLPQTEILYLYQQVKALWNPALFFCLLKEMQKDSQILLKQETPSNMEEEVSGGQ